VAWSAVDRFSMTSVRRVAEQADLPSAQFVLLSPFPRTVDFDKWAAEPRLGPVLQLAAHLGADHALMFATGSAAWCILAYRILPRAVLILGVTSLS